MSFRNTFVTEFIYQASEETKDANAPLTQVFERYAYLEHRMDERGYGYFAGVIKTGDSRIDSMSLPEFFRDLCAATKVPFRIVIMVESGPVIVEHIEP